MLTMAKKTLLFSLFVFSTCIFSSGFTIRRVTQAVVARTLNKSAFFRNSHIKKYPWPLLEVIFPTVEETTNINQITMEHLHEETIFNECTNLFSATDNQEVQHLSSDQALSDIEFKEQLDQITKNRSINVDKNIQEHVAELNQNTAINKNWQRPLSQRSTIQDNHEQISNKCFGAILSKIKTEATKIMSFEKAKSQLVENLENYFKNTQNIKFDFINFFSSLSECELQNTLEKLAQPLPQLKTKFQSLCPENSQIDLIINSEKFGVRVNIPENWTKQDYDKAREALTLKIEIESRVAAIHAINHKLNEEQHAHKILLEKQPAQKVELAQHNQEQETFISSEQCVQNQHDACTLDLEKCPDPGLEQAWADRQDALCNTIEQGYAQFDQEFDLTPELLSFLTAHDIDPKEFQNFYGTSLQQQLHKEMCAILSQTAQLESKFPYQSNLINNIVNVADAAHDANKNGNVLLASRLIDVDSLLLKISHEIFAVAMPYAQAATSGLIHSVQDFIHTVAHPIETAQNLGKAIYYVLETAALNCYDEVDGFEDIYIPLRDQRNAEIIEGLKNLGEHMTNASGPEKFEALVRFGADFFIPGKIIHAVGGVCDVIKAEANIENTAKLVAGANEQATIVKNSEHVAQTIEKIEALTQEKIAQSVAKNLLDAEQSFDKTVKSISGHCIETIDQSKATPPRTAEGAKASALRKAERLATEKETLPDGRIRYYEKERLSDTPGPTRGRSFVTEFNPKTGSVRQWNECYDHAGKVNRVRPTMINGRSVSSQHYPATYADIQDNIKGSKWRIPKKNLD